MSMVNVMSLIRFVIKFPIYELNVHTESEIYSNLKFDSTIAIF